MKHNLKYEMFIIAESTPVIYYFNNAGQVLGILIEIENFHCKNFHSENFFLVSEISVQ